MKAILTIAACAAALTLSTNVALADPGKSADAMQHAEKMMSAPTLALKAYANAIAKEDVAEMENYVATKGNDFSVFEGKGANIGWADYRDHHLVPEMANPDLTFHSYVYKNIKMHTNESFAYATFSIAMSYTYKGEDKSKTGNGTAILKRFGDSWKIVHLQTS
jgi:SnoaL-like domain